MKYVTVAVVGLASLLAGAYLMGGLVYVKFMAGYCLAIIGALIVAVTIFGVVFKVRSK